MFFHLQLDKDIEVEPRFFGPRLQEILKQKVTSEVRLSSDAATAMPLRVLLDSVAAGSTSKRHWGGCRSKGHAAAFMASCLWSLI